VEEIEELKKQILAQNRDNANAEQEAKTLHEQKANARLKHLRANSGSPTPHHPLGRVVKQEEENGESIEGRLLDGATDWSEAVKDDEETRGSPKLLATISKPALQMKAVFGELEEDEDVIVARKKITPFEITREDRLHVITPEERKRLVKELIDRIPTGKEDLFSFGVCWDYMDASLVEQRVRPWVNKKIKEYIGDEEPSLVVFICEKIVARTEPHKILSDLAMVLDEEAEVFTVKLWRLIVYESEAKRLGLNSSASPAKGK